MSQGIEPQREVDPTKPPPSDVQTGRLPGPWRPIVGLGLAAPLLALLAWLVDRDSFQSGLASNLLQAAVVVTGGAVIAYFLKTLDEKKARRQQATEETNAKQKQDLEKRIELFRRMRAAHVRVAQTQLIMRAEKTVTAYAEQMRLLMQVARDLEEIREEVKVTDNLYEADDRHAIVGGIADILEFLDRGIQEYVTWSNTEDQPRRNHRKNPWLAGLIETPPGPALKRATSDPLWEPAYGMPLSYDNGLMRSKAKMRAYVYEPAGRNQG